MYKFNFKQPAVVYQFALLIILTVVLLLNLWLNREIEKTILGALIMQAVGIGTNFIVGSAPPQIEEFEKQYVPERERK